MTPVPWRSASSLILIARNPLGNSQSNFKFGQYNYDYNVLILKRSAKSSFMAKAYVFPGGVADPSDFAPSWQQIFNQHGYNRQKLISHFAGSCKRPPLYSDVSVTDLIPEVGFRINAIRETFEETGFLLCKPESSTSKLPVSLNLEDWRDRVHQDPKQFEVFCRENRLCPNVWSLFEWSNWLTPVKLGPKRFDTIFYVCVLDYEPHIVVDEKEITDVKWLDPVKSIWEHVQGHLWLAPPQIYELSRLAHFPLLSELKEFARNRENLGSERWLPILIPNKDQITTALPGDELYADLEAGNEASSLPGIGQCLNRMAVWNSKDMEVICNIVDPCGHRPPINLLGRMMQELSTKSGL